MYESRASDVLQAIKFCKLVSIGMFTVRIFGQFSFQFSMENESKIKSKIEESMKMNLHGTFS